MLVEILFPPDGFKEPGNKDTYNHFCKRCGSVYLGWSIGDSQDNVSVECRKCGVKYTEDAESFFGDDKPYRVAEKTSDEEIAKLGFDGLYIPEIDMKGYIFFN